MIEMTVYDGKTGEFLSTEKFFEPRAKQELEKGNAVEVFDRETNEPVANTVSYSIRTDGDGFASIRRE